MRTYLDMDGTIADLYSLPQWLDRIQNESEGLFLEPSPLITEDRFYSIFPKDKYNVKILTMLPLGATKEYEEVVKQEKLAWLSVHFPSLVDKVIFKRYGHNKNIKGSHSALLIDDNDKIRETWKGKALNPKGLLW